MGMVCKKCCFYCIYCYYDDELENYACDRDEYEDNIIASVIYDPHDELCDEFEEFIY